VRVDGPVKAGVLPAQWLRKAYDAGWLTAAAPLEPGQVQPASVDLRLGPVAYRLRCSFLPGARTVAERLPDFVLGPPIPLTGGAVLDRRQPYLIPLQESLALPETVHARANPKSSTGRLDIFTRLITDGSTAFDDVPRGYRGGLYLELVSRSFTIHVQEGLRLNQLRLTERAVAPLKAEQLRHIHASDPLLMLNKRPVSRAALPVDRDGLFLSLALAEGRRREPVGWRAKKNSSLVDLTQVRAHDPYDFWEPVLPERGGGVILEPEEFYLLLSREGVRIPPDYASEMEAFDPTSGELRTHYAGFFDPGFGHSDQGYGSRAALEVRAHDVPFKVEDGQRVCKLVFLEMAEPPDTLYGESGSNYQFQAETLSKHFVHTTARQVVAPPGARPAPERARPKDGPLF
jgi:dCTP deaminase